MRRPNVVWIVLAQWRWCNSLLLRRRRLTKGLCRRGHETFSRGFSDLYNFNRVGLLLCLLLIHQLYLFYDDVIIMLFDDGISLNRIMVLQHWNVDNLFLLLLVIWWSFQRLGDPCMIIRWWGHVIDTHLLFEERATLLLNHFFLRRNNLHLAVGAVQMWLQS